MSRKSMLETGGISKLVVVGSNPDTLRISLKYFRIHKLKLLLLNEAQILFPVSIKCSVLLFSYFNPIQDGRFRATTMKPGTFIPHLKKNQGT